ncbi:hypothetical protein niasHT_003664 [Heterodera trifolii]|uniref:Uncharacterized protein n=1 Tax=Heterodera trifolii TaxID=157864 RepID=A0ABD2MAB4_9BILA
MAFCQRSLRTTLRHKSKVLDMLAAFEAYFERKGGVSGWCGAEGEMGIDVVWKAQHRCSAPTTSDGGAEQRTSAKGRPSKRLTTGPPQGWDSEGLSKNEALLRYPLQIKR